MKSKTPSDSRTVQTEIVLPNDTNNLNNLRGGTLLHWMDIAAAISAYRHCGRIVVTASVNHVSFTEAIKNKSDQNIAHQQGQQGQNSLIM